MAVAFMAITFPSIAQPYWNEIQAFKQQDSISFPAKGQILFVGSSSFHYWKDVQQYFPKNPIINRGFGGSSLPHVIKYADKIIYPYKPKQVVVYCGENDINDGASPKTVLARFKLLYNNIRQHLGNVNVLYVSIKPSPSREKHLPAIQETNTLISKYLSTQSNVKYVDVYSKMMTPDGKIMQDIFGPDMLHMNAKGYTIWAHIIKPYLL